MAVNLSPIGGVAAQFFDNSGNLLSGGKIYTYTAGTTTPQVTYTSASGATAHSNPIILDAAGRVPSGEIWLTDGFQYKFLIKTSTDVQIGSYDNIVGINSNFVNYTSSQEFQTATAGQTVFTLTTMQYQPGTNSLSVFVDGVNQYGPGALYAYVETSSTVVTFTSGLHVGADVKFTTTAINSSAATDAEQVAYIPPFTNSIPTNVELKLAQTVSVKDFGAVGNGIADDTIAVQAALNSQQPLDWGGLTYRITATVSRTYTSDLYWEGRNATIIYDGVHVERAVLLQGGGIEIVINNLMIDGGKLCNKCIDVLNDSDNYANITFNNVFATRAKRISTLSGGDGIRIRGSFNAVTFNGGKVSDCELPAGQGTPSFVGIAGISVDWYTTTRYVKAVYANGIQVEKIYSSDLAYQSDQDGLTYFAPTDGAVKVPSLFSCVASTFTNCYGRSIKTQCRDTVVTSCAFIRSEGLTSGTGNGEIDAQTGNGNFRDLTFSYTNAQQPGVCLNVSGSLGTPGMTVDGCSVFLDAGTTLSTFAQVFPSNGSFARHAISNCKVYGKVVRFFLFLCNGANNYAEVSNNYVKEIVNGSTSEKALVYAESNGVTTPYGGYVTAFGNVYADVHLPAIVRDNIPGTSVNVTLSAWNNTGFLNDVATASNTVGGLKTNQVARLGKITGDNGRAAYFDVISKDIASGATETFSLRNQSGSLVFIQAQYNNTAYALIASDGSANAVISKGTAFEVGNTTEPATGTFRVWSSATREISVKNTDASSRVVSVFVMAP